MPLQFFSVPFGALSGYLLTLLLFDLGPGLLVSIGVLGTLNLGLIGLGIATARERSQGWMRLKQASPMPPLAHFGGKVTITLLGAAFFAAALLLFAAFAGHLQTGANGYLVSFMLLTLGVLPFCALGLVLAYAGGPNTAQTVITQVTFALIALAFLSLFDIGSPTLSAVAQMINTLSPAYHLAVLAIGVMDLPVLQRGPAWQHTAALLALTLVYLALAVVLYRRDEGRTYG